MGCRVVGKVSANVLSCRSWQWLFWKERRNAKLSNFFLEEKSLSNLMVWLEVGFELLRQQESGRDQIGEWSG